METFMVLRFYVDVFHKVNIEICRCCAHKRSLCKRWIERLDIVIEDTKSLIFIQKKFLVSDFLNFLTWKIVDNWRVKVFFFKTLYKMSLTLVSSKTLRNMAPTWSLILVRMVGDKIDRRNKQCTYVSSCWNSYRQNKYSIFHSRLN